LHATAEQEYLDIRKAGFKQPVCVVPNGVDIPEQLPLHLTGENKNDEGVKEVLFLGRLHPVKGIDILISAWSKVAVQRTGWQLRIVGLGTEDYVQKLRNQVERESVPNFTIEGPLYGQDKRKAYQRAKLYVLPHTQKTSL